MKPRLLVLATMLVLACSAGASLAQQQTGTILGRVSDATGAVLPGVTVTISSPGLLQPRVLVTAETGTYRAPDLPIGLYTVRFDMEGFRPVVNTDIQLTIGFNAEVNGTLEMSAIQEAVTVSGKSPIVDTRATAARTTFDLEALQSIPSARDPWVMLARAPAIAMDRANVGGNQSGQQSGYASRGGFAVNNQWSIDGVNITDMSATGSSPSYYDFDMLQEMQVTTGGADASQQTGGVGINLVTRGGTDQFRGSGRFYVTDDTFQADNVTDELRAQKAGAGNPIQNIKDYGFEVGGPILRGSLWFWGSYGKQDVRIGVVNFYKNTPTCRPPGVPVGDISLILDTETLRDCLETDLTTLNNYNYKVQWAPVSRNKFSFQNSFGEKVRSARDASDTRPIETTYRQVAASDEYGTKWWNTGPNPFYKISDQHIFSDRWLVEAQWAHLGNNFALDFHEDSLYEVQPSFEITTSVWGRSYRNNVNVRPTNSVDLTTNYFLPAALGGDHALKGGLRWRIAEGYSTNHRGGNTEARFRNGVASEADLWRDALTDYDLTTWAVYAQDTYAVGRFTFNLGVRWDHQRDEAIKAEVPAHPFAPQWLPAVTFNGADSGVVFDNIVPRLGANYDIRGDAKTIAKASWATYYGQLSPGGLAGVLNPVGEASIRFPWSDASRDGFVQASELDYTRILNFTGNYNPDNPTALVSSGRVDPDVKNDRTREFIAGIDHELTAGFALGASYIWRTYDQFRFSKTDGLSASDYVARTLTPAATACPTGSRCETVTYYEPTFPIPGTYLRTNLPDFYRDYNGVELTARRRYANRWAINASVAYNDAKQHFDSPAAYAGPAGQQQVGGGTAGAGSNPDPTNIDKLDGAQYAPESTASGLDNVYVNTRWLVKVNGIYTLPWWEINVAGVYSGQQGYPWRQTIQSPSRANRAGIVQILLDPVGELRYPTLQTVDLRVDKTFRFAQLRIIPSMDVFNVGNVNTVLARRLQQNSATANQVSNIVAPRVIRFGVRVAW